jgi:hypothetical protein
MRACLRACAVPGAAIGWGLKRIVPFWRVAFFWEGEYIFLKLLSN